MPSSQARKGTFSNSIELSATASRQDGGTKFLEKINLLPTAKNEQLHRAAIPISLADRLM